jgi:hypothetical protein
VSAFIAASKKYLDGGNGNYLPYKQGKAKRGKNKSGIAAEEAWERWSLYLENLFSLNEAAANGAGKFLRDLGEEITRRPALALIAMGYSALTLLRSVTLPETGPATGEEAAALALHWQLDRIMRECWESAGIPGDEARRAAEIALAVLSRTNPAGDEIYAEAKTTGALGAAIILENHDADDFRKILGVNRFDDVIWFNKEAFEECLFLVPFFLFMESTARPDSLKCVDTIAAVAEAFREAEEASGYRLDELAVVLAGSPRGEK